MKLLLFSLLLCALGALTPATARADCADCATRAAQFWPVVAADVGSTSPALADYLATHEISHRFANEPIYFLTPDCGLYPDQLEAVLDSAKQLNVHMTIFLMGSMLDKWPDAARAVVQRAVAEGHELALHSYSHRNFRDLTHDEIYDEVVRNWALIDWALGYHYPMRFIRMPYGARDATVMQAVGALGVQSVFWDIDSLGWYAWATAPIVLTHVVDKMRNGALLILHCSSVADRAAFPLYVTELRARGFEPKLLSAYYPRPTAADIVGYPRAHATSAPLAGDAANARRLLRLHVLNAE